MRARKAEKHLRARALTRFAGTKIRPLWPQIVAALEYDDNEAQLHALLQTVAEAGATTVRLRLYTWRDVSDVHHLHDRPTPTTESFLKLTKRARELGLSVIGQPHAPWAVEAMRGKVDGYKIASYDVGRGDIISLCDDAPLFVSAGQIPDDLLRATQLRYPHARFWHTVNRRPCPVTHAALWRMREQPSHFWGYADHTLDPTVCALAVATERSWFIEVPVLAAPSDFHFGCSPLRFAEIAEAVRVASRALTHTYGSRRGRNTAFEPYEPAYGRKMLRA